MPVFAYFVNLGGFAESRHVGVFCRALVAAPSVICPGDLLHIRVGEFAVDAVHQSSHLARINEQGFATPVAETPILLVPCEEPEADRNLRRVKELTGQRHHAVHQIRLNHVLADFTFAGLT